MAEPVTVPVAVCPPGEILKQFLNAELGPEDSARVALHIDSCRLCQEFDDGIPLPPEIQNNFASRTDLPPQPDGYEVFEILGVGGMGVVWRAREKILGGDVALKVMKAELCGDEELKCRFLNEARIPARLAHPNIVAVSKHNELADGRPYYVMNLADRTLASELHGSESRADRLPHLLDIFAQVCKGVGYAHGEGIIHRDLKPVNIMLGKHGEVLVVDWGIAKVLATPEVASGTTESSRLAETWHDVALETGRVGAMGTWIYMSPEQACDRVSEMDQRSDVFALGAILCEILTGSAPYSATELEELKSQAKEAKLTDAFARLDRSGADPALIRLAKRCLARDKSARPADGCEVAEAVTRYLDVVREREQARKRRPLWLALAASVLVAVGLAVYAMIPRSPVPIPPDPTLRVGLKQWVGYTPLVVLKELKLGGAEIEFVTLTKPDDTEKLFLKGDIDVAAWLVDTQVRTTSGLPTARADNKVVLMLDVSLEADAILAKPRVKHIHDVLGVGNSRVAYQEKEPSGYLLRWLCDRTRGTRQEVKFEQLPLAEGIPPHEAARLFAAKPEPGGESYDVVGLYEPKLQQARETVPGSHILFSGKDVDGKIVDILTVRTKIYDEEPDKVEKLIRGWFEAISILRDENHPKHEEALLWARRFNGTPPQGKLWDARNIKDNEPCSTDYYKKCTAATQMRWGDEAANRAFFQHRPDGTSPYRDLFLEYRKILAPRDPADPADSDGSDLLAKMYRW